MQQLDTRSYMSAFWGGAGLIKRPDLLECKRYCLAYECSADVIESVAFEETVKHFKLTVAEAEVLASLLTQPEPILNLPEGEEF